MCELGEWWITDVETTPITSRYPPCSPPTASTPPTRKPRLDAVPVVDCRTNIEVERHALLFAWVGSTGIEVNDITNIGTASIDQPVVSVEWRRVPQGSHEPSFWCPILGPSDKADQPGPSTSIGPHPSFPHEHLFPCLFIDGIVDRYDGAHIACLWIVVFTHHGVEELLFGRIDPFTMFVRMASIFRRIPRLVVARMGDGRFGRRLRG